MKKVNKKLSLNKSVIAKLAEVKGGLNNQENAQGTLTSIFTWKGYCCD